MTKENMADLNSNVLVGYGRGAWWTNDPNHPNLFDGPVPEDRLLSLFGWDVIEKPIEYLHELPMGVEGPAKLMSAPEKLLYRSDTGGFLGTHGLDFAVHSYTDTLYGGFVARGIIGKEIGVASAGLLRGGGQAWVSLQMPDTVKTSAGVEFRPQLLNFTSLDGSLATDFKRCSTLTVCDNTFSIARKEGGKSGMRVKHTKNSVQKLETVMDALTALYAEQQAMEDTITRLTQIEVSDKMWSDFLALQFPAGESKKSQTVAETNKERVTALWTSDKRVSPWKNTGWGLQMAINTDNQWNGRVNKRDGKIITRAEWQMEKNLSSADPFGAADMKALANLEKLLIAA